jgi:peptidase E
MAGGFVVMAGGGFSLEPDDPRADAYVLALARRDPPRVCFVPTASGDAPTYLVAFYRAFTTHHDCRPADLALSERTLADLEPFLLEQDVIYVGGGSTANLLAVWRVHGLPAILRRALDRGAVLAGISAGMNCWFEASTTDSFGPLAPLHDGLGMLSGSACPHYDGEPGRRPLFHRLVAGGFPAGVAADEGAALRYTAGGELVEAVTTRRSARAYRVERGPDGGAQERALPTRLLEP